MIGAQGICDMEYIAVLNNYLEYSLDDKHTVNLSFQSTSEHVFHAEVSIKCCVTLLCESYRYLLKPRLKLLSVFSPPPSLLKNNNLLKILG